MVDRIVTLFLLMTAMTGPARAQFTALKIVETGVNYPGAGTFSSFGGAPSQAAGTVSFTGAIGANIGVFTVAGGMVSTVALTGQPLPGGGGNFVNFNVNQLGQSASGVGFLANSGQPTVGVFANVGGSLATVAQFGQPWPGAGGGTISGVSVPSIDGTTVAFGGTNGPPTTALGIFTRTGSNPITAVATTATPVPDGAGNFLNFNDPLTGAFIPAISGNNVVYGGQGGGRFGVFASFAGTHTAVAHNMTAVPGGVGNFTSFQFLPAIDGSEVAFAASSTGRSGIYRWTQAGGVTRVTDTTLIAPGSATPFTSFVVNGAVPLSLENGRIAFIGTVSGQTGLYTDLSGTLSRVVRVGDMIDGKTVSTLTMSNYSLSTTSVTAMLRFTDNSFAIYSFTPVSEPVAMLLVTSVVLIGGRSGLSSRFPRG